jgi:hypothetical protein
MDTKQEITMKMVTDMMDETYSLIYIDYRDSLDNRLDTIEKCIRNKSADTLYEDMDEWFSDNEYLRAVEIMEDLKKELVKTGYKKWEAEKFFEENEDDIKDIIFERNDSDPLKDLIRNTNKIPVRIELLSNYDCINSHWLESSGGYRYEQSYFGDMVDALRLNPHKVKKILLAKGEKTIGYFPNKYSRNGKEQVSYEQLYEELENSTCGANLLTYVSTVDVGELIESNFNLTEIIVPKGNMCGLYSSMQGGGSILEMELKRDVKLRLSPEHYPYFRLSLDKYGGRESYNYSIKEVYGLLDSFYGKPMQIISQPQINQTA